MILPNNKNIQMVAQQVQKICAKEVAVIGSRTIARACRPGDLQPGGRS